MSGHNSLVSDGSGSFIHTAALSVGVSPIFSPAFCLLPADDYSGVIYSDETAA